MGKRTEKKLAKREDREYIKALPLYAYDTESTVFTVQLIVL